MLNEESGEYEEFDGGSNMSDAAPYELSIGSGSFIEGFEDGLIGVIPSQTSPENMVKLDLKFPDDYSAAELASKDVTFYVYVSWIVQYEMPEYNEDFIKNALYYTPTTSDAIGEHKAYLRKTLEESFESSKKQEIESAIWSALYAGATVLKYPESEIEYFYNAYYKDLENEMTMYNYYYGYGFTDIKAFAIWYLGLDENGDWQAAIKDQAYLAVKQTLIYHAIAQQCGISSGDAEFEATVAEYIEQYKQSGKTYTREEIIEQLGEAAIREGNLYEAVVAYIKERATITLKPVEE
jgi:trigger factor